MPISRSGALTTLPCRWAPLNSAKSPGSITAAATSNNQLERTNSAQISDAAAQSAMRPA